VTASFPPLAAPFDRTGFGVLRAAFVAAPHETIALLQPTHGESHAIAERAREQFGVFTSRLRAFGVATASPVGEIAGSLIADCAVVFADGAFVMRPSDVRRRGEVAGVEAELGKAGVPIVGRIEAPGLLDGGDVLVGGDRIFIGVPVRKRSEQGVPIGLHGNALGREQLAAYARSQGFTVVEIAMDASVVRLRSVAAFVDAGTAVIAPRVLDATAFAGFETIDVPFGEEYGAGLLAIGPRRVLANVRFREMLPRLRRARIAVDAIDLWEFGKVGVTPSIMALSLKRG